jgi:hypothetical protein
MMWESAKVAVQFHRTFIRVDVKRPFVKSGDIRSVQTASGSQHQTVVRHRPFPVEDNLFLHRMYGTYHALDALYSDRLQHGIQRHANIAEILLVQSGTNVQIRMGTDRYNFDVIRSLFVQFPSRPESTPHSGKPASDDHEPFQTNHSLIGIGLSST